MKQDIMENISMQELTEGEFTPFMPLLSEIECGDHFSESNPEHVAWLQHKIQTHVVCGTRFFGYHSQTGEAIGIVGILIERKLFCDPTAEIMDIGVVPAYRRSGLGTKLLHDALAVAKAEGVQIVFARTYAADTGTIAFYGRNAFYPVAVIPGTNGPTDEGDVVMRRHLIEKEE
jgi:GNAT superfamily N-acetyltransferase